METHESYETGSYEIGKYTPVESYETGSEMQPAGPMAAVRDKDVQADPRPTTIPWPMAAVRDKHVQAALASTSKLVMTSHDLVGSATSSESEAWAGLARSHP